MKDWSLVVMWMNLPLRKRKDANTFTLVTFFWGGDKEVLFNFLVKEEVRSSAENDGGRRGEMVSKC